MTQSQIPALIFLSPFLFAFTIPFIPKVRPYAISLAVLSILAAGIFSLLGLFRLQEYPILVHSMGNWPPPFGIEWLFDRLSAVMAILITGVSFCAVLGTRSMVQNQLERAQIPYTVTTLLHVSSLLGMILTHDLFNLFVFLEVSSLTGYALIASGDRWRGNVSSFRYLLIGTLGASFYLLGVGYLYAATGTLNMRDMAEQLIPVMNTRTVLLGIFFIILGLIIKAGLFPFHGWLPDAYTYASDPATSLIAPLMTKTAIYAVIRILFWVVTIQTIYFTIFLKILLWLGAFALVIGSIWAFLQTDFKRMLAYSSISQIGLIFMAVGLQDKTALSGAILHILFHAVTKLTLFLIAAAAFYRHGVRNIFDFWKLRHKMPWTLGIFVLAALSLTGVPPLSGFFSKWYILVGALQAKQPLMAFLIAASSLLTALYFFKVIEQGFFVKSSKSEARVEEAPLPLLIILTLLALAIIVLGFCAPALYHWLNEFFTQAGIFS